MNNDLGWKWRLKIHKAMVLFSCLSHLGWHCDYLSQWSWASLCVASNQKNAIASGSSRRRGTGGEGDFMPGICSEKLPGIYRVFHPTFGSWNLKWPKFAVHIWTLGTSRVLSLPLWKIFKGNVSQTLGRGNWNPNLNNSQGGSRTSFRSRHLGKPNRWEGKGWISEESRFRMFFKGTHCFFVFWGGWGVFVWKRPLWLRDHHFFFGVVIFVRKSDKSL